jgi:hypothetical protein
MSGKRGRPKKAIARREIHIGFCVTNEQFLAIQRKVEEAMVNISDYMRQVAIAGEVRARWTAEERDMVRRLIGMSADLHRLAERSQEQEAAIGVELFKQFRDDLDVIINYLCHDR